MDLSTNTDLLSPADEGDQQQKTTEMMNCCAIDEEATLTIQETYDPESHEESSVNTHLLNKWDALLSSSTLIPATSNQKKSNHSDRLMQECFSSGSSQKTKRRKTELFEVHSGRIVRSTGRKDRHSKVCTAKGPKDRRVRLSPKTAIQFYDVQDRLGYDRPSKAIDWLMKEAQAAIDVLNEPERLNKSMSENHGPSVHCHGNNSGSTFSFNVNGSEPSSSASFLQAFSLEDSNTLHYQPQIFDENSGTQRFFTWNFANPNWRDGDAEYVPDPFSNSPPLNFVGPGQNSMFMHREPLQSSFSINSPMSSSHFPGISSFSGEELLNFASGAATLK